MADSSTTLDTKDSDPSPSIDKYAKERDAIWSEIDASILRTSDLKSHLNTLTVVGQLANEVLAEILVAYARDHFHSTTHDEPYMWKAPQWIKLAHVCRRWHEVAFGTPRFWSYVRVRKPKTFSALLPLSKRSPLYLDIALGQCHWFDSGAWISATELIRQEVPRLQELRCVATPKQFKALAQKWAYTPMGLLKKLVLSQWDGQAADDTEPFHFLSLPGSRQAPRLGHLELRQLPFLWTDPIFSSALTTLVVTVKASRKATPVTGTFEHFMDALKAMAPSLVHLTLEECIPRLHSPASEPPRPTRWIHLPSLRSLRIVCNTNDCVRLTGNLYIDSAAKVDVVAHGATGNQRLVQLLSSHISRSAPLLELKIFFPGHSRSKVTVAGYKDADLDNVDLNSPAISLTLSNAGQQASQDLPLTAMLRGADMIFSRVQTLRLSTFSAKDYDVDWPTLFLHTPSVETLDIAGHPGKGFFKALSCDRDVRPQMNSKEVPLTGLREVRLGNARFHNPSWGNCRRKREGEFVDELCEWAVLRRSSGLPLERLRLRKCEHVVAKDVGRLGEIVAQVEWDRWERKAVEAKWMDRDDDFGYGGSSGWY